MVVDAVVEEGGVLAVPGVKDWTCQKQVFTWVTDTLRCIAMSRSAGGRSRIQELMYMLFSC